MLKREFLEIASEEAGWMSNPEDDWETQEETNSDWQRSIESAADRAWKGLTPAERRKLTKDRVMPLVDEAKREIEEERDASLTGAAP